MGPSLKTVRFTSGKDQNVPQQFRLPSRCILKVENLKTKVKDVKVPKSLLFLALILPRIVRFTSSLEVNLTICGRIMAKTCSSKKSIDQNMQIPGTDRPMAAVPRVADCLLFFWFKFVFRIQS